MVKSVVRVWEITPLLRDAVDEGNSSRGRSCFQRVEGEIIDGAYCEEEPLNPVNTSVVGGGSRGGNLVRLRTT